MLQMTPEDIQNVVAQDLHHAHMADIVVGFTEEWTVLEINGSDEQPVVWFFTASGTTRSYGKFSTGYPGTGQSNLRKMLETLIDDHSPLRNEQANGVTNYFYPEVTTFR